MLRQFICRTKPLLQARPSTCQYASRLRFFSTQSDETEAAPSPGLEPADQAAVETFEHALKEEGQVAEENVGKAVEDYAYLLESTREKMRLTVEWRGDAQSERDILEATARRVGLEISDKSQN